MSVRAGVLQEAGEGCWKLRILLAHIRYQWHAQFLNSVCCTSERHLHHWESWGSELYASFMEIDIPNLQPGGFMDHCWISNSRDHFKGQIHSKIFPDLVDFFRVRLSNSTVKFEQEHGQTDGRKWQKKKEKKKCQVTNARPVWRHWCRGVKHSRLRNGFKLDRA